jgi:hypothetical protein
MINPFDKKDTPGGAPAPIMAPGGAPAPSATDLPQSLEAIESQEKSAILERLKQTTFDF